MLSRRLFRSPWMVLRPETLIPTLNPRRGALRGEVLKPARLPSECIYCLDPGHISGSHYSLQNPSALWLVRTGSSDRIWAVNTAFQIYTEIAKLQSWSKDEVRFPQTFTLFLGLSSMYKTPINLENGMSNKHLIWFVFAQGLQIYNTAARPNQNTVTPPWNKLPSSSILNATPKTELLHTHNNLIHLAHPPWHQQPLL